MPLSISDQAIADKNKLRSDVAWIDFVEFLYPGEAAVRVCSDNRIVNWNGHDWYPVEFVPPNVKESKDAQIPDLTLAFADVDQQVTPIIDRYDGAIGAAVNLYTVLSTMLDSNIPEREETMELLSASIDHQSVITFTLGAENLQDRKCTPVRYLKNHCRYTGLSDDRCGYTGSETDCNLTFARCKELGNQARFGGFPGVGRLGWQA